MKIFVSKHGVNVRELKGVDELHVSHWKNLVITFLNHQSKPFSECFDPNDWDSVIINKRAR